MIRPRPPQIPRTRGRRAPPLNVTGASSNRGAHRRSEKQRKHNGAGATILDWAPPSFPTSLPPKFLHLEKDASDGTNDPIRLQQSDHGLYKGYQELARHNGRRETQMEADGAEGQSLPEQGKDVWRRQQRRRRESAFTSGSRFSLHPGLPPSLMRARRRKEPEDGASTVV